MTDNTQPKALRLAEQYDYGDLVAHSNMWKAAVCTELRRQHARIAELEAEIAGGVQALSVLEDAARWQELREQHESDEALCCVFAPNDMRECLVPVGSLPGELDAFMDSERAARKQGANHD